MRNYLVVVVSGLISFSSVFANEKSKPASADVPPVMYEFLGDLIRLQPYMVSEKKFVDPTNAKEIQGYLDHFVLLSKRLPHTQRLNSSSFQIPAQALQAHLAKLSEVFREGRKPFARRMLNATMDGCSSCHTQVPSSPGPVWQFRENELHGNLFEQAEFLFATRHYDEALKKYDEFIRQSQKSNSPELKTALQRKLFIFVRVMRAPERGAESFQKDASFSFAPHLKTEVQGWIGALKKVSLKKEDEAKLTAESLENLASQTIPPLLNGADQFKPESLVMFLYTSGLIFNFINTHPEKDLTPDLLYWLALCDNHLTQNFFFSLTDLYLKECISRFPKSPTAKKCYNELESSTMLSYSGSGGLHLPTDVKQELDKYKKMIEMGSKEL
jgi:hypothetical protein